MQINEQIITVASRRPAIDEHKRVNHHSRQATPGD
jgi:hypothetical protein